MPNLIRVTITFEKSGPVAPSRKWVLFTPDRNADMDISPAEALSLSEDKGTWTGGFERIRPLNGMIAALAWEFSVDGALKVSLKDETSGWSYERKIAGIKADKTGAMPFVVPA